MLLELFKTFSKIGAFTFGGGYAMIPMIEAEVVDKHHWISREEFIDLIAVAKEIRGLQSEIKDIDAKLKPYFKELGLDFPFE